MPNKIDSFSYALCEDSTYLGWIKVWNGRYGNVRPQVVVLANVCACSYCKVENVTKLVINVKHYISESKTKLSCQRQIEKRTTTLTFVALVHIIEKGGLACSRAHGAEDEDRWGDK